MNTGLRLDTCLACSINMGLHHVDNVMQFYVLLKKIQHVYSNGVTRNPRTLFPMTQRLRTLLHVVLSEALDVIVATIVMLGRTNTTTLVLEPGWQRTSDVQSPVVRPFSQETGPTDPLPHSDSPLECFNQMFGVDFFGNLVAATNANAAAKHPPTLNVYAIPTGIQRQLPRCRHLLESTLLWGWPTCRNNVIRITGQRNPYSIIHTWG